MHQVKVNGVLMPEIYYSLKEAMNACNYYKETGRGSVWTEIVPLY